MTESVDVKPDTKQRILDSAESLFAQHGFSGVSLRAIIAEANVNLAAIHYHYRSKEALFDAVVVRRVKPINQERLALLDRYQRAAGNGRPELEQVLDAFLAPVFRVGADPGGSVFVRLIGRIFAEETPVFSKLIKKHFGPVLERFIPALQAAVPELPLPELLWRLLFMAGALTHTLRSCGQNLEVVHGGLCDVTDVDGALRRLISFAAAGFRAPVPSGVKDV
ncbi:MAG TPA: TetR family transcriptional regulator [Bryobacteraceae bacterium]|jgi:AcrR family transcriptional regulator|nr:TetR family transcriptional regulator [Bryobacteraceae bacterium]